MRSCRRIRPHTTHLSVIGVLALVAGSSWVSGALAQSVFDRSQAVGVLDRPHPEYDAQGMRAGTFLVYPRFQGGVNRNSNVYATETNKTADTVYAAKPSVAIQSQWSSHSLALTADADLLRHSKLKTENTTAYQAAVSGRLDVQRDSNVSGSVALGRAFEARTSPNFTAPTRKPVQYDTRTVSVRGMKQFNRLQATGSASLASLDYRDSQTFAGATVDQDFRDSDTGTVVARLDYAVSPATAVFGEVSGTKADVDRLPGVPDRGSSGVRGLTGVNFSLTNLITGEVSAGYLTTSFDDGVTSDVNQAAYRGNINWYVTPLVTLTGNAERQVLNSGAIGSPAYVSDSAGARADYEARRNFIISGRVNYSRDAYQNLDRDDKRLSLSLTATYLLNRNVGVTFNVQQVVQDSFGAARTIDYDYGVAGVGLVLRL